MVKPVAVVSAGELCEQSIMQCSPWLVLHPEQLVFFTFQKIQFLDLGNLGKIY